MSEYNNKYNGGGLFVRLGHRESDSVLPRLRARRTGDRHASIRQWPGGGRAVYGTTSLEELKVTPEAEDERYLVVAILENQLARELRIK